MDLQPTLENDLVLVRPLHSNDFEALYTVASDPLIWELHQNPDRWEKNVFHEFFKDAIASKGAFAIFDKKTKAMIGSSRFKMHEHSKEAVEIGWTFLGRAYWGGVYNASFKNLLISHAFQYVSYVLFNVDQNNFRSQKAVKKLGGLPIDRSGSLKHLHTPKPTGITFVISKSKNPS